jgi:hypothetical protein
MYVTDKEICYTAPFELKKREKFENIESIEFIEGYINDKNKHWGCPVYRVIFKDGRFIKSADLNSFYSEETNQKTKDMINFLKEKSGKPIVNKGIIYSK